MSRELHPTIAFADGSSESLDLIIQEYTTESETELKIELLSTRVLDEIRIAFRPIPDVKEIFLTAPNFNDIITTPPGHRLFQGIVTEHRDTEFGQQWMFSPSPLVFPLRTPEGWLAIALAAPAGRNSFSGWSFLPSEEENHTIAIHYDGKTVPSGHIASIWIRQRALASPDAVIRWYAEKLRERGWAPSPKREQPKWWREPMLCTWGEQCNQAYAKGCSDPTSVEVNMYETQDNQLRWLNHLEAKGVPVGLISMSDKWQLLRERLLPDALKYNDLRGFADEIHRRGKHVIAWFGLWEQDRAPDDWCLHDAEGNNLQLDPESPGYASQLVEDVRNLLSPEGYDLDGFFLDFTANGPLRAGVTGSGERWGIELLYHYVKLIYDAAKSVKSDALIMTHCCHPLFADVTDVLRLNDYAFVRPNVSEQARYRHSIASACSDWLINTDNWFMYDIEEWRRYLPLQPELGIPASWYAAGIHGDGSRTYEAFNDNDYQNWSKIWQAYRAAHALDT